MGNKLKFLEGIRGLAALIVAFGHMLGFFYMSVISGDTTFSHTGHPGADRFISVSPFNLFFNGNFAVCIFFVLSGFVLSYKYFNTGEQRILAEYSAKRYIRLLFPILFSVVCTGAYLFATPTDFYPHLDSITHSGNWLTSIYKTRPTIHDIFHSAFIDVFINEDSRYGNVLWTMTIEFLGSLFLFAVLAVTHYTDKKTASLIAVIIFLIICKLYYYTAFFAGALLCKYYIEGVRSGKVYNVAINALLLISGLYFASYPSNAFAYVPNSIYKPIYCGANLDRLEAYHILGAVLMLACAIRSRLAMRFFSFRLFSFFGKISFSLYLMHCLVYAIVMAPLFLYFQQTMPYNQSAILAILISVPVVFLVSYPMYLFIDKPTVVLSNRFGKYFTGVSNNPQGKSEQ